MSPAEFRPEKDSWKGPAATVNYIPILSSERACHNKKTCKCLKIMFKELKEKLVTSPRWWPHTRRDR
jgi:hypothetical protein